MLRNGDALFGVGLLLLWIGGLATGAAAWLTWAEFCFAICAFYLAAYGQNRAGGPAGTIALAIALLVVAIIGASGRAQAWLSWSTFGLACLFGLVGAFGAFVRDDSRVPPRLVRRPRVGNRGPA